MTPNSILLQAFHTGEDIYSMVLQDVARAVLCECAVHFGIYFPGKSNMQLYAFTQLL